MSHWMKTFGVGELIPWYLGLLDARISIFWDGGRSGGKEPSGAKIQTREVARAQPKARVLQSGLPSPRVG